MAQKNEGRFTTGFYELADCDTRTNVIAYYNGTNFYMPGSELAHPSSSVAHDGQNEDGRFHYVRRVGVDQHAYGSWNVESGKFL